LRILLDQNLSPRLIRRLADILPGLESVYDHDLTAASDPFLFEWSRTMGFAALISADRDFVLLAERLGPPPKIIRIERCDFPSGAIEKLIRREATQIQDFLISERAVLTLNINRS
jgi:predicted nuclease of predicted toxin-antitoxin system